MAKSPFRSAYDGRSPEVSDASAFSFVNVKSRTHQSFKSECDVNNIIKNLDHSGFLDAQRGQPLEFVDVSHIGDYHSALNSVLEAEAAFGALDATVRARFKNDPGLFVDFFNDPANQDEAIKLGLATDLRPPAPAEPSSPAEPLSEVPPQAS